MKELGIVKSSLALVYLLIMWQLLVPAFQLRKPLEAACPLHSRSPHIAPNATLRDSEERSTGRTFSTRATSLAILELAPGRPEVECHRWSFHHQQSVETKSTEMTTELRLVAYILRRIHSRRPATETRRYPSQNSKRFQYKKI